MEKITLLAFLLLVTVNCSFNEPKVIFAVNVADNEVIDSQGITYAKDTNTAAEVTGCENPETLRNIPYGDAHLYRNVRYGIFGYNFQHTGDGYYTIVLKSAECWTKVLKVRVFHVLLNQRKIISDLDVLKEVGHRTVFTEHIRFSVCDGKLYYDDGVSKLTINQNVRIDLVTVNGSSILHAMVVLKQLAPNDELPEELMATTAKVMKPVFQCPRLPILPPCVGCIEGCQINEHNNHTLYPQVVNFNLINSHLQGIKIGQDEDLKLSDSEL